MSEGIAFSRYSRSVIVRHPHVDYRVCGFKHCEKISAGCTGTAIWLLSHWCKHHTGVLCQSYASNFSFSLNTKT